MATQTTNLGLTKPDAAEGYDVNVFNTNADIVDGAVGALLNELGGTGGGLGDKVDALQADMTAARSEIAAVKTDTAALVQALATANANIATLLTQTKGVKAVVDGSVTTSSNSTSFSIPHTMNPERVVIIFDYKTSQSVSYGVFWTRIGYTVTVDAAVANVSVKYQIIEFY